MEKQAKEVQVSEIIEITPFGFLAPLFFIWVTMNANFSFLFSHLWVAVVFIILALNSKMIGTKAGNWLVKGPMIEGVTVRWGINARGATRRSRASTRKWAHP